MTTELETPTTGPERAGPEARGVATNAIRPGRLILGLLVLVVIFAGTYAYAWYQANNLSQRFVADADASYKQGEYLKALVGSQDFDPKTNKYVKYGGYLDVEKIWSSGYSWPVPPEVQRARQRSQEIYNQKLTTAQAEQYIRDNTGRPGAPYFAEIYLRLGELYEQQGDIRDAKDIYQSMAQLFPDRKDLIAIAQQRLQALQGK